jgi:hypothetical protein
MGPMDPYRERVRWPGWFLVALALIPICGFLALVTSDAPGHVIALLTVVILAAGYGIWRLRHIELEFGREGVGFGFGGISRRVPRDRVVSAEAKAYSVARYMGWGYRLGWERRERAYSVLGCPRGVLVTFDDERGRRWKVFLSSREPEKAVAALGS